MSENIESENIKIALMGPQSVGKTTYLGSMFHCYKDTHPTSGIRVETVGRNASKLQQDVQNNLVLGKPLLASFDLKTYEFKIQYTRALLALKFSEEYLIRVGDYAGEIFQHLNVDPIPSKYQSRINDFVTYDKWLVLLNDWEPDADTLTAARLRCLLDKLTSKQRQAVKVAVVMSKCERGELWPGKNEPEEDIFSIHLRQTYRFLKNWFRSYPDHLKFFASSSFGVIDPKTPLPNREYIYGDGKRAVPRKVNDRNEYVWEPHGLLTPFAWLSSAKGWQWNEY